MNREATSPTAQVRDVDSRAPPGASAGVLLQPFNKGEPDEQHAVHPQAQCHRHALNRGAKISAYLVPAHGKGLQQLNIPFEPDLTLGAMIRCDWNGDGDNLGTFEVKNIDGNWVSVGKLGTDDSNHQLVSSYQKVTQVHVQRGPDHPGVRFAVKLIPITWLVELVMPEQEHVEVTLGEHYVYKAGYTPNTVAWKNSEANQGTHKLIWSDIDKDQDYEMWIKLWHPDGSDATKLQDPVIRTGAHIPD